MKLNNDPAFLFYPSDFLVGTMLMTNEEVGKYIKLLCIAHSKGGYLTKQDMFRVCNENDVDVLNKFIKDGEDIYYNERLLSEITKRIKYSESRRNNLKGSKMETHMDNHMETHMDNHMENININDNNSINSISIKDKDNNNDIKDIILKDDKKLAFGSQKNVKLTANQFRKLTSDYENIDYIIEWFSQYITEKGYKSKEHNLSIRRWVVEAYQKNPYAYEMKRYE